MAHLNDRPMKLQEKIFERLLKAAEIAKMDRIEYAAYEDSLKYYRDMNNVINTSYGDGLLEGEQLGLQKGEQIGLQKGEQIGLQKGEQIGLRKLATFQENALKNLIVGGMSETEARRLLGF